MGSAVVLMDMAVGWVVKEVREGKSVLLCTERLDRLPT